MRKYAAVGVSGVRLIQNSHTSLVTAKLMTARWVETARLTSKVFTKSLKADSICRVCWAPNTNDDGNSSFPSNHTTSNGETKEVVRLCPPLPNTPFESLETPLPYILNAVLNVPRVVATTFVNLVVLLAMRRITSIPLRSKLLLCSLGMTDLGAGSVVQPQWAAFLFLWGTYLDLAPCPLYRSITVTGSMFTTQWFSSVKAGKYMTDRLLDQLRNI